MNFFQRCLGLVLLALVVPAFSQAQVSIVGKGGNSRLFDLLGVARLGMSCSRLREEIPRHVFIEASYLINSGDQWRPIAVAELPNIPGGFRTKNTLDVPGKTYFRAAWLERFGALPDLLSTFYRSLEWQTTHLLKIPSATESDEWVAQMMTEENCVHHMDRRISGLIAAPNFLPPMQVIQELINVIRCSVEMNPAETQPVALDIVHSHLLEKWSVQLTDDLPALGTGVVNTAVSLPNITYVSREWYYRVPQETVIRLLMHEVIRQYEFEIGASIDDNFAVSQALDHSAEKGGCWPHSTRWHNWVDWPMGPFH